MSKTFEAKALFSIFQKIEGIRTWSYSESVSCRKMVHSHHLPQNYWINKEKKCHHLSAKFSIFIIAYYDWIFEQPLFKFTTSIINKADIAYKRCKVTPFAQQRGLSVRGPGTFLSWKRYRRICGPSGNASNPQGLSYLERTTYTQTHACVKIN